MHQYIDEIDRKGKLFEVDEKVKAIAMRLPLHLYSRVFKKSMNKPLTGVECDMEDRKSTLFLG